jgi:hypothetical protein
LLRSAGSKKSDGVETIELTLPKSPEFEPGTIDGSGELKAWLSKTSKLLAELVAARKARLSPPVKRLSPEIE